MFSQLDIPNGSVRIYAKNDETHIIGIQVICDGTSRNSNTNILFIDSYGNIGTSSFQLSATTDDMHRFIEHVRMSLPNSDVFDMGRYCIVSNLGADMLITLTTEGRISLRENGTVPHMFQEMLNGTRLTLHLSDTHPNIIGPYVSVRKPLTGVIDTRIWYFPECEKMGARHFWESMRSNGYVILNRKKFN